MTPRRRRRIVLAGAILVGLGAATTLTILAIGENMLWFFTPSQLLAEPPPPDRRIRVGGLVVEGSVTRQAEDLEIRFDLTDHAAAVTVVYRGLLPDLFREGQGIVALGTFDGGGRVVHADEVLAKHDENYMPPELDAALRETAPPSSSYSYSGQKQ